jgi:hypothetical protein
LRFIASDCRGQDGGTIDGGTIAAQDVIFADDTTKRFGGLLSVYGAQVGSHFPGNFRSH